MSCEDSREGILVPTAWREISGRQREENAWVLGWELNAERPKGILLSLLLSLGNQVDHKKFQENISRRLETNMLHAAVACHRAWRCKVL